MSARILVAVLSVVAALCSPAFVARADSETGQITVIVKDDLQKALATASVTLFVDGVAAEQSTDDEGVVRFREARPMIYRATISLAGYSSVTTDEFEVLPGQDKVVSVTLARLLPIIGRTVAKKSRAEITTTVLDDSSPERLVSSSLVDGLAKLAGVSVTNGAFGRDFGQSISINGQDPSSTSYSVNGSDVGPSSGITLAGDLFTGASVTFSPGGGYLGGLLNYSTIRPTKTWQYKAGAGIGNFGYWNSDVSATGSFGKLGLAAQYTSRSLQSYLDGRTYADQSGSEYAHRGGIVRDGKLFAIRYPFGSRVLLNANFIDATERSQTICGFFLGALPCGDGPYDSDRGLYHAFMADALATVGSTQIDLLYTRTQYETLHDARQRQFLGHLVSTWDASRSNNESIAFTILGQAGRHSLRAQAREFMTLGAYDQTAGPWRSSFSARRNSLYSSVQDRFALRPKLIVSPEIDLVSSPANGSSLSYSGRFEWNPTRRDAVSVAVTSGRTFLPFAPLSYIGAPSTSTIDCANGSTLVNGPTALVSPQTSSSASVVWTHGGDARWLRIAAGATSSHGGGRSVLEPLTSLPPGLFPGGFGAYWQSLLDYWSSPNACGGIPLPESQAYAQTFLGGIGQSTQYVNASGRFWLARVLLLPNVTYNRAYLTSLPAELSTPGSIYAVGRQLPGVPKYTAGLTADAQVGKAEILLNTQLFGLNNGANQPPYMVVNSGAVFRRRQTRVTLLLSNVFNVHSDGFTFVRGINPVPLVGGGLISFPTSPLPPRQITISVSTTIATKRK